MAFVPVGYLSRLNSSTAQNFAALRNKAKEINIKCELNVAEVSSDERFIEAVMDKLARDNDGLMAEVQSLEEQLAAAAQTSEEHTAEKAMPPSYPASKLLTTTQVAQLLNVHPESVRNYVKRGWLNCQTVENNKGTGYVYMIHDDAHLREFIRERAK